MNHTPHQERSAKTLEHQVTQELLYSPSPELSEKLRKLIHLQMQQLGMFNLTKYLAAKQDKRKGGEGMSHLKYYVN